MVRQGTSESEQSRDPVPEEESNEVQHLQPPGLFLAVHGQKSGRGRRPWVGVTQSEEEVPSSIRGLTDQVHVRLFSTWPLFCLSQQ
jgi:hypothetical protein